MVAPSYQTALLAIVNRAEQLARAGTKEEAIYADLAAFNTERCEGLVSESELRAQARINVEINGPGSYQVTLRTSSPPKDEPDQLAPLKAAIAKKDNKALLDAACVSILATLKREIPLQFAIYWEEIRDAFKKSISLRNLEAAVTAEKRRQDVVLRGQKKDVADVAREWATEYRDAWAYDEAYGVWRFWNGTHWQEEKDRASFLDQYAIAALQEAGIAVNGVGVLNTFVRVAAGCCKRRFTPQASKINFDNGTLDLSTMELQSPHRQEDLFTYCLPYSFDPHKPHARITQMLLETVSKLDPQTGRVEHPNWHGFTAICAQIGLSILRDITQHKAIVLLGPTRAGKTTVMGIVNLACGQAAKDFAGHDIFSRDLEGKRARYTYGTRLVTCIDEVPAEALKDEETVKQVIAHSGVSMRGMHKEEEIGNTWYPKIFMAANDDPHYKDMSGAIKERLIFIRCPNQRAEEPEEGRPVQNPDLLDELMPEIGAFVVTCLHFALQVQKRRYFPQSAAMKRDRDFIAVEGNPLKACLEEKFVLDADAHTVTDELYVIYKAYCKQDEHHPLAKNKFSSALCGMNIGITARKQGGQRALLGIRLRANDEPYPAENEEAARYKDSPLLDDGGRLDGYKVNRPHNRPLPDTSSQADLQEPMDGWTADSQNFSKRNIDIYMQPSEDVYISHSREKMNRDLAVQPSTTLPIGPLQAASHGGRLQLWAVHSRPQPSTEKEQVDL
jgi:phage/plasmid-associated DNA primase